MPIAVERLLTVLDSLNEQVLAATKELSLLAKEDPTCVRLMRGPESGSGSR